jgi:cation diffusion facilitator CzcD-associated flavoprotein CzcO
MGDFILPFTDPAGTTKKRAAGPIHAERHVKIICIGAGASGLLFAYKMQKHFQNYSLTVYEKNIEVSGTWFENRYPGYVGYL